MREASFLRREASHSAARARSRSVEIVGLQDKHLGPRFDYARVSLRIEQAPFFEVVDKVDPANPARDFGYPETFTRGVLEIVEAQGSRPPLRLVLEEAACDPVDSSPNAFVEAGRDAGRKLLALAPAL